MIKQQIVDGKGRGEAAYVEKGALVVAPRSYPDANTPINQVIFRQLLMSAAGATDMRADGSTTPVRFVVSASPTEDIYIGRVSFTIADAGATLSKFGNITALSNGCKFFYQSGDVGEIVINDSLKSNYDFVRLSGGNPAFGDGTAAFRANNVAGASEGYLAVVDIQDTFGIEHGIHLRAGTKDALILEVRDDVTGIDLFEAVVYGKRLIVGAV